MKAQLFEKLIRKIVREEIDYALRRELKSLKEDLRDEIKPVITEQPIISTPVPDNVKTTLKEKIMGKNPIKKQNFVKDSTLNSLLNETAMGDTNTQTAMAPTETMPTEVANVVTRDYRELMQAIDKKKGK
tara:strand:+ start:2636 stop:3025 length:390 start_codon:yes stop_codon:yes gene_type:complete